MRGPGPAGCGRGWCLSGVGGWGGGGGVKHPQAPACMPPPPPPPPPPRPPTPPVRGWPRMNSGSGCRRCAATARPHASVSTHPMAELAAARTAKHATRCAYKLQSISRQWRHSSWASPGSVRPHIMLFFKAHRCLTGACPVGCIVRQGRRSLFSLPRRRRGAPTPAPSLTTRSAKLLLHSIAASQAQCVRPSVRCVGGHTSAQPGDERVIEEPKPSPAVPGGQGGTSGFVWWGLRVQQRGQLGEASASRRAACASHGRRP